MNNATLTRVALAGLIFSLQGAARSADPPRSDKTPISDNVALVEITAPTQARILIDGGHETSSREVTFGSLKKGQLAQHELTAQFSSGGTVSKTLLLRGGSRYCVLLRDPRTSDPQIVVQAGQFGAIWSVAFSPDGKKCLTGSEDGTAVLWDAATGAILRTFSGHRENVMSADATSSVAFSRDGKSILTASWAEPAILWDAKTGNKLRTFEGYRCAAFSPDGRRVLTGSEDKTATLWDCTTGKSLRQFEGDPAARNKRIAAAAQQDPRQEAEVRAVAFSADGKRVLTGEAGNQAILWDAETGKQLRTFKGHQNLLNSVAFSPDGRSILTGSSDNTAILWDAATGARLRTFSEHARGVGFFFPESHDVSSVAFSPDGNSILTGSWDQTAILSDVGTGKTLRVFKGHNDHVTSVAFSPDGKRALTGSREGRAILWDVSSGSRLVTFEGNDQAGVTSIALSPDERLLLAGYADSKAVAWDTVVGARRSTFLTHQRDVVSVAFSPDGKQVLTGSIDGGILWNSLTRDKLRTFKESVRSAAFSPDGKSVLTWQYIGGKFCQAPVLWDAASGKRVRGFPADDQTCVAFSPDGKQILFGHYDGTVSLWDMATGSLRRTLKEGRGTVGPVAFSPDGKLALIGFGNGSMAVWNVGSNDRPREFAAHARCIGLAAFSPDGKQVLAGCNDKIVLWDAATGDKLRTFEGDRMVAVRALQFLANGRFVASGTDDGNVRVWDIATGDELCRLIALAGDDWLVVTPEGLYDGSPGGLRKVTYRFNNELSVVPAEKLNKDFRQPGLLARLLKGERLQTPEPHR